VEEEMAHTLSKASLVLLLIGAGCNPIANPRNAVSERGMAQPIAAALAYSHIDPEYH